MRRGNRGRGDALQRLPFVVLATIGGVYFANLAARLGKKSVVMSQKTSSMAANETAIQGLWRTQLTALGKAPDAGVDPDVSRVPAGGTLGTVASLAGLAASAGRVGLILRTFESGFISGTSMHRGMATEQSRRSPLNQDACGPDSAGKTTCSSYAPSGAAGRPNAAQKGCHPRYRPEGVVWTRVSRVPREGLPAGVERKGRRGGPSGHPFCFSVGGRGDLNDPGPRQTRRKRLLQPTSSSVTRTAPRAARWRSCGPGRPRTPGSWRHWAGRSGDPSTGSYRCCWA